MDQGIFMLCIAGAVAALAFSIASILMGRSSEAKLRNRLVERASDPAITKTGGNAKAAVGTVLGRLGAAASKPFMPKNTETVTGLRKQLGFAGIYATSAVKNMTGAKVICLAVGLIGGYTIGIWADNLLLALSVGGLLGYLGPTFWLKSRIKANQKALNQALPDALDLMVVCVESGLTVDAAMQRVGTELGLAHPALSRELGIAHMETRVGLPRVDALRNLGIRTGNAALQSLSAMLIQADRFGTSIAQALRVHADTMRTNRQLAAEEMAAKASVKMSFPLVLFIFPATFIVLCGPTVIGLMNSSFMKE